MRAVPSVGSPRRWAAAALLLGLLALAASSLRSARLEPADCVINLGTEVASLDPGVVTGVPEGHLLRAIFEGLVVQHPRTAEPLPGVAERWEVSGDGLVYTFHLRDDARWTNGDPVTAHDFVYSWNRVLDPRTAAEYAYQLWYVEGARAYTTEVDEDGAPIHSFDTVGIRAPDDWTLEVTLDAPTAFFLDLCSFYTLYPVNRRNIEEAQERWPDAWRIEWLRPENLVTNGPFRVAERRVNDRIRLVKYERYWDAEHVAFRTIDALPVDNYNTMLNLYLTGEVDWIDRVAPNAVPHMRGREDFDPEIYLGSYFYRVNVTRPPFDDPRLRRALALTIDRTAICEKVTKAGEVPAFGLTPLGLRGFRYPGMRHTPIGGDGGPTPEEAYEADCAEARQILAEAGYGPGGKEIPTIEIHYNTSEAHRDIAEVIADAWKRNLGIRAKMLNQEFKVYLDTQRALDYDVSRSAWIADYPDPNTFVDLFVTGGENNKTGWGNPEYDRLVETARLEPDPAARMEHLARAEEILLEELPILPIYHYVTKNVVNPRLGGFHENSVDNHYPKFWYWMSDEELAAKRAAYDDPSVEIVSAPGPADGLHPPAGLPSLDPPR